MHIKCPSYSGLFPSYCVRSYCSLYRLPLLGSILNNNSIHIGKCHYNNGFTNATNNNAMITSNSRNNSSFVTISKRHRFYKPLVNDGINLWRYRMGRIHKGWETWSYKHTKMDKKENSRNTSSKFNYKNNNGSANDYFGKTRLWNPIAGKIGYLIKKKEEFNWPEKRPPPKGLRESEHYFPFFYKNYFPEENIYLILDSVLNNETTRPVFHIPCDMSKKELINYLSNIYNINKNTIVRVHTRNRKGKKFKNEVGEIKTMKDYKVAVVELDTPVMIEFKQIKGTEDTPDNRAAQIESSS